MELHFIYTDPAICAQFDWVFGKVYDVQFFSEDIVILNHTGNAFSVVNQKTKQYFGCCPSREYANRCAQLSDICRPLFSVGNRLGAKN